MSDIVVSVDLVRLDEAIRAACQRFQDSLQIKAGNSDRLARELNALLELRERVVFLKGDKK